MIKLGGKGIFTPGKNHQKHYSDHLSSLSHSQEQRVPDQYRLPPRDSFIWHTSAGVFDPLSTLTCQRISYRNSVEVRQSKVFPLFTNTIIPVNSFHVFMVIILSSCFGIPAVVL